MRPLPQPESVVDARKLARHVRFATGQQSELAALGHRSIRVLDRCFEALPSHAPHGFYQTPDFIDVCRRRDARERLFRAIFWQLASKEVERGRLRVELAR